MLCKIAEHLVKNRLEWFIESNNFLTESQFGFRKGKSTMDSISILTTDIRIAFSSNAFVVAAFLDISAAYDNVVISILKRKLLDLKVPVILVKFIINVLSERIISLVSHDSKISRTVYKGLPQGSVLSPLLYNIYVCDLESSLNNSVNILQYADDLLLYSINEHLENACSSISVSLNLLKNWLDNNGLELSASKSEVVVFSRKRTVPSVIIKYDDQQLPVRGHAKFLGVILDNKLSGLPHFEYLYTKCERLLNMMRCLSGVWWELTLSAKNYFIMQ